MPFVAQVHTSSIVAAMLEVPANGSTPILVAADPDGDPTEVATTQPATQATTQPATQPAANTPEISTTAHVSVLVILLGFAAVAWVIAWLSGLLRGGVAGPDRMAKVPGQTRPLWSLPVLMLVGMFAWLFGLTAAAMFVTVPDPGETPAGIDASVILLNVSAMGGAILGILAGYFALRAAGMAPGLGLSLRQIPRGVLIGFTWLIVVMPTMFAASVAFSLVRALLGYDDQVMHGLLEAMRDDPSPTVIMLGVVSAVVLAPLAEELLFRGVIQTLIGSVLARLAGRPADESGAPVTVAGELNRTNEIPSHPPPTSAMRWTAIVVTGLGFAVLHEAWSIPIIFLLALLLGWAYEKTGNLWVPIVMHMGFNACNIFLLLLQLTAAPPA